VVGIDFLALVVGIDFLALVMMKTTIVFSLLLALVTVVTTTIFSLPFLALLRVVVVRIVFLIHGQTTWKCYPNKEQLERRGMRS